MKATHTPAMDAKIIQWSAEGVSTPEQARRLGVPLTRVESWRRRLGLTQNYNPLPETVLARIRTWIEDGWPIKEIAETAGISLVQVRRYFPGAGIQNHSEQGSLAAARLKALKVNPRVLNGL